ncbi:hypothetical protein MFIFM68171_00808 [Madurella fahalii]|uniref:Uncharacterized protein n=1 Tax=Madurella fahalii TaxID=1157608 RepID=A0ABQ0FYM0_9PEZI
MDLAVTDNGRLKRFADEWTSVFSTPQVATYAPENTPFWARLGHNPNTSTGIIKAFMKYLCDDPDPYLYQAVEIEGFCSLADLAVLKSGDDERVRRPIALLDDRNDEGTRTVTRGTCRPRKGALTAHQLYVELSKARFRSRPSTSGVPNPGYVPVETDEPDADRRLIYVADADCWSVLALVATASYRQAGYFRDFIYRHLAFKTFLGVHMSSIGFPTFALEFHFPFYAWRRCRRPIEDRRRRANGKPLRRSRDLNFLLLDPPDTDSLVPTLEDCIYEAQISCIVTGFDERCWVALAFVDTYYKGGNNRESAEYYADQVHDNAIFMDPLTRGRVDADIPTWKPREYFLRLLESRANQVRQEWHNVVSRLLQITEQYVSSSTTDAAYTKHVLTWSLQTHDYLLPSDDISPDHTERYNKRVQRFSNRTIRFLQQVSTLLSKTIDAWKAFHDGEMSYFSALESPSERAGSFFRLLLTIDKYMLELRDLRQEVENQKRLLENLEREITQHLQQDGNRIAILQQQNSEHTKLLAIIALIFMPISTSLAMFDVDDGILPFRKSFGNYVLTTICFGCVMLVISTTILKWSWHHVLLGRFSRSGLAKGWRHSGTEASGISSPQGFQDDIEML